MTTFSTSSRRSRASSSEIGAYLQQIPSLPRLDAEEERRLAEHVRYARCAASRERLVCGNLRLVVFAAKSYRRFGVPLADLVEAGNLGLLRAVDRFDPSVGTRFSTYAMWWIKHAILRSVIEHGSVVRCPERQRRIYRACQQAQQRITASLGQEASIADIALATGLSSATVQAARSTSMTAVSGLDENLVGATLCESGGLTPSDDASQRELEERLHTAVSNLLESEKTVVRLHFGLDGQAPLTINRIAAELRIPTSKVNQRLSRALARMRTSLEQPASRGPVVRSSTPLKPNSYVIHRRLENRTHTSCTGCESLR